MATKPIGKQLRADFALIVGLCHAKDAAFDPDLLRSTLYRTKIDVSTTTFCAMQGSHPKRSACDIANLTANCHSPSEFGVKRASLAVPKKCLAQIALPYLKAVGNLAKLVGCQIQKVVETVFR